MPAGMVYGHRDRILVVGGGPAGLAATDELRRLGFPGQIIVLCGEPVPPYDRTACSKGLLKGSQHPRDIQLDLRRSPNVDWRLGKRALSLAPEVNMVVADRGDCFRYDGLIIACGGRTVLPAGWPREAPGLHPLRGLADAHAIRRDLRHARRVVVVGGGLTGCEVACGVHEMARQVTIVESGPCLMARAIGEPVGALITTAHRAAGIDVRLRRRVRTVERDHRYWRLTLDDGTVCEADLVVVAAGERPDVSWLTGSGLDTSDGVLCDETLRAVDRRGLSLDSVVVAGAAARFPGPQGGPPRRYGHWIAAVEQGQAAARTLLLGRRAAQPVAVLPRFSSEQLGLRLQVCGQIDPNAEIGLTEVRPGRRDPVHAGVLVSYHRHGQLIGVVAVNAPHMFAIATRALLAVTVPVQRPPGTLVWQPGNSNHHTLKEVPSGH